MKRLTMQKFTYDNLTDQEYMLLVSDDDVEVLEHSMEMSMSMDEFGAEVEAPIHSLKISRQIPNGQMRLTVCRQKSFSLTHKHAILMMHIS